MAKAYSDDLRRKVLEAYTNQEGTIAEIALRFRVSVGYVKKILGQYRRTEKMERAPHHPGRKPLFTPPVREQIRVWLKAQPDLTLAEMQEKFRQGEHLKISLPSLFDFAVLVFTADDYLGIAKARGFDRSNVAFEAGLFVGRLGIRRTFFMAPRNVSTRRFASDLAGVSVMEYDPQISSAAAIVPAAYEILKQIRRLGPVGSNEPREY